MGLESATYISQLNAAWPIGASDPKAQGDDHLRLIKSALQASFPNISGAMTVSHTALNALAAIGLTGFSAPTVKVKGSGAAGAGAATTALRSDMQALLDLTDTYAWTGQHSWTQALRCPDGAVAAPGITFSADIDVGIWRAGPNDMRFAIGGNSPFGIDGSAVKILSAWPFQAQDGTVGTPAIGFVSDPDTGIYRVGANEARMGAGGGLIAWWNTQGIGVINGAAALPSYHFVNDTTTGFYRDTASQIGIALAGVTAGQISQGSFVMTLTGFTAAPTPTATWQRFGNMVHVRIPQFNSTSNGVGFTCTNWPAAIQPSVATTTPPFHAQDNSANVLNATAQINGATATFQNGVSGWTAALQKGLGIVGVSPSINLVYMM